MAIIKCKMCGGDIVLSEDKTYGTCEYCGSTMTFPKVSDEQRLNLFNRANHFRRQNEFDKAIAAYDKILDQDDTDAEAHWGAVLSRYGIEYVEDPVTHERIPTCHRVQLGSILTDADYLAALRYAPDPASRDIYEKEARRIAEIQKGILAISSQEKPYDVFICYKETDDSGSRTKDSTLAQDIYYQLTNEGYKVFFSRITLEDKLGREYEPYIFAALNSAKVMLVIGTRAEYFNAVWVKNEWSRYLDLMKRDRNKLLIPCYRDMDPYDLPEELSALQSQDMSKIGFIQDIIRGVKKVLNTGKEEKPAVVTVSTAGPGVASLHKRAVLFLEDGDWDSANEYFDRILDIDPEYAPAYIGKVQVANQVRKEDGLARCEAPLKENTDYQKAVRFANEQQRAIYEGYNRTIEERLDRERKEAIYREADALEKRAATEADFLDAAKKYDAAGEIRDARERAVNCHAKAAAAKQAAERQAEEYKKQLEQERQERLRREEEARLEAERKAEQERIEAEKRAKQEKYEAEKRKKRNRLVATAVVAVLIVAAGAFIINSKVIEPRKRYNAAQALLDEGNYEEAAEAFAAMEGYSNSAEKVQEAHYRKAMEFLDEGQLSNALGSFREAGDYADAAQQAKNIENYSAADSSYTDGEYLTARPLYAALGDFKDSAEKLKTINEDLYAEAKGKMESGDIAGAYAIYSTISDYSDSAEIIAKVDASYQSALDLWEQGDKTGAETALIALAGWSDADAKIEALREEIADDAAASEDYNTALAYYAKLNNQTEAVNVKITTATKAKAYQEAVEAFNSNNLKTAYSKFSEAGDYEDAVERAAQLDKYIKANEAKASGAYADARAAYLELGDYLDSSENLETCNKALYDNATAQMESGDIAGAYETYSLISGYANSAEIVAKVETDYQAAKTLMEDGEYDAASVAFAALKNYSDSLTQAYECLYRKAGSLAAEGQYVEAVSIYTNLGDYSDSAEKAKEMRYKNAKALWNSGDFQGAAEEYKALGDYSDAKQQLKTISAEIADKAWAEKDYVSALTAYQRLEQTDEIKAKEYELAQLCYDEGHFAEATSAYETLGQYELSLSKLPIARYAWADQLFNEGNYAEAAAQFAILGDITDSAERAKQSTYMLAGEQLSNGEFDTAKATFQTISGYSDADTQVEECDYRKAVHMADTGDYEAAQALFESLGGYSDSETHAAGCVYARADMLFDQGDYSGAHALYSSIHYQDSADRAKLSAYQAAQKLYDAADYAGAETIYKQLGNYEDSAQKLKDCRYRQGDVLMAAEKYSEALKFYDDLDYQDSDNKAAQCHYHLGYAAQRSGGVDGAVGEYVFALGLPETQAALTDIAQDYSATNEIEKTIQVLWLLREDSSVIQQLNEIAALKTQNGEKGIALLGWCAMGDGTAEALVENANTEGYETLTATLSTCDLLPEVLHFSEDICYTFATAALANGAFDAACDVFSDISDYKNAATQVLESQYQKGMALLNAGNYDAAIQVFGAISSYKDSKMLTKQAEADGLFANDNYSSAYAIYQTIDVQYQTHADDYEQMYDNAAALLASGDYDGATTVFQSISGYGDADTQALMSQYQKGVDLRASRKYDEATVTFESLGDYKDAARQALETQYQKGNALLASGEGMEAIWAFRAVKGYGDSDDLVKSLERMVADRISCGAMYTVGLKSDGSVVAAGQNNHGQCDVSGWRDIVAVSCGGFHTVGLKSDGKVVVTGENDDGQCDVSGWNDIVAVSCGEYHTVGLKSNGKVVATRYNKNGQCDVSGWSNIVAISCGDLYTVGLKSDGTAVAVGYNGFEQCNVSGWSDIVAIACGEYHTVGLKSDGTVVATGDNAHGRCNVSGWSDIVAVSCGAEHTVGLKLDGTVFATGYNNCGQCDVSGWSDIVAISCGAEHTVGLKSDGKVVATGNNVHDRCNVSGWRIDLPQSQVASLARNTGKPAAKEGTQAKLVDGWYLSDDEKYAVQPSELVKKSDGIYSLSFKVRNQSTGKTIYDKELEFKADGELTLASDNMIQDFTTGKDGKYRFILVCDKKEGNSVVKFTKKISFKAK